MNVSAWSISFSHSLSLFLCIDLVIDSLRCYCSCSKVHSNHGHQRSHMFYEEIKSIEYVSLIDVSLVEFIGNSSEKN